MEEKCLFVSEGTLCRSLSTKTALFQETARKSPIRTFHVKGHVTVRIFDRGSQLLVSGVWELDFPCLPFMGDCPMKEKRECKASRFDSEIKIRFSVNKISKVFRPFIYLFSLHRQNFFLAVDIV
jgi:hypothetical protein